MTKVLIAVDGSQESNDAAVFAHRLFGDTVDYLVITVAETGSLVGGAMPLMDPSFAGGGAYIDPDLAKESVESAIHDAEERASDAASLVDLDARPLVETGEPAEAICRAATDHAVDLIIVGSHQRNWFSRLITPSVRNHLIDHAPCPVLVVR